MHQHVVCSSFKFFFFVIFGFVFLFSSHFFKGVSRRGEGMLFALRRSWSSIISFYSLRYNTTRTSFLIPMWNFRRSSFRRMIFNHSRKVLACLSFCVSRKWCLCLSFCSNHEHYAAHCPYFFPTFFAFTSLYLN